jgi:hypothetical protein
LLELSTNCAVVELNLPGAPESIGELTTDPHRNGPRRDAWHTVDRALDPHIIFFNVGFLHFKELCLTRRATGWCSLRATARMLVRNSVAWPSGWALLQLNSTRLPKAGADVVR